ncbi:cysteine-rich secretory protein 3-like [Cavia porcellus]|uniref:cysteine-rich secretory protein 3-like n=1 Tax=Cavia porcellus TaxID=10141 RepID=UPI000661C696|nr:cysteine-rich secretory protein 3-like [Cavia porcellus]
MKRILHPAPGTSSAMALFPVILFLVAVLLPSFPANGNEEQAFAALSTTLPKVQEEIVNKHNELRRAVSPTASDMLKMRWSSEAAKKAQAWADQCKLKHSDAPYRKLNTSCGENLFMSSAPYSWSSAIQEWYDERENFKYNVGPLSANKPVGHYTQVAWFSSFQVGCGVSYCPSQPTFKYFMVCHYCPAGNNLARLYVPYKQGASCASCPDHCEDRLCTNACEHEDDYSNCVSLKKSATCNHPLVKNGCKASCFCENKIH